MLTALRRFNFQAYARQASTKPGDGFIEMRDYVIKPVRPDRTHVSAASGSVTKAVHPCTGSLSKSVDQHVLPHTNKHTMRVVLF